MGPHVEQGRKNTEHVFIKQVPAFTHQRNKEERVERLQKHLIKD